MKQVKTAKPSKGKKRVIIVLGILFIAMMGIVGFIQSKAPKPVSNELETKAYQLGQSQEIPGIGSFTIKEVFTKKELKAENGYRYEAGTGNYYLVVKAEITVGNPITMIKQAATEWKPIDDIMYTMFPHITSIYGSVETSRFSVLTDYPHFTTIEQLEFNKDETKTILFVIEIPRDQAYEEIKFMFQPYGLMVDKKAEKVGSWGFIIKPEVKE